MSNSEIKHCANCGGPFRHEGDTCSEKCDRQLSEKIFYAEAAAFFRQFTSNGGLDSDEAKTILHERVDEAFTDVVAERRRSFRIVTDDTEFLNS